MYLSLLDSAETSAVIGHELAHRVQRRPTSKSKSVIDLLDMTAAEKKLINWADSRGSSTSRSAKKPFKGKIKLVRVEGQLHFEVPITAQVQNYKVLGQAGRQVAHVLAYETRAALNQPARLLPKVRAAGSTVHGQVGRR
ncbi:hypothetical protein [Pseudomonas agarici]|nr:hypothetical protein [Pseudomonas agarici]NWB91573.1 hypothetical protein [Pseudomonas agarici]NWC10935.1 hypothetical protein [Pseudomonas agarici]